MNREIKFRVWDKVSNHYIIPWKGKDYDDIDLTYSNYGKWYITGGHELSPERYEIQQFTGLKDSKGVEIYEGDILKIDFETRTSIQLVKWNGTYFGLYDEYHNPEKDGGADGIMFNRWVANKEVIGNIFENGELLTESRELLK